MESGGFFWALLAAAVAGLIAVPLFANPYTVILMSSVLTSGILALSLSVLWGYTGVLSLGQGIFYGLGGYVYAVLALNIGGDAAAGTFWASIGAVILVAVPAVMMGAILFYAKLRGVYIAILTLVATMLVETFMVQTTDSFYTIGVADLGGANGMSGIPAVGFDLAGYSISIDGRRPSFYYLVLGLLLMVYLGLRALVNSKFGFIMVACREDPERTAMFGFDVRLLQLGVFAMSASIAGLAGVLNAAHSGYVEPSVFGIQMNILVVIWVAVGGRTQLTGAVLGALVLQWLNVYFLSGTDYAVLAMGMILIISMMVAPQGLYPAFVERLVSGWRKAQSVRVFDPHVTFAGGHIAEEQ